MGLNAVQIDHFCILNETGSDTDNSVCQNISSINYNPIESNQLVIACIRNSIRLEQVKYEFQPC